MKPTSLITLQPGNMRYLSSPVFKFYGTMAKLLFIPLYFRVETTLGLEEALNVIPVRLEK